jgi:hypothetical protein
MAKFSQAQLDALDEALKNGSCRVHYPGKNIQYDNLAQVKNVRHIIATAIASGGETTSYFMNAMLSA